MFPACSIKLKYQNLTFEIRHFIFLLNNSRELPFITLLIFHFNTKTGGNDHRNGQHQCQIILSFSIKAEGIQLPGKRNSFLWLSKVGPIDVCKTICENDQKLEKLATFYWPTGPHFESKYYLQVYPLLVLITKDEAKGKMLCLTIKHWNYVLSVAAEEVQYWWTYTILSHPYTIYPNLNLHQVQEI